MQIIALLFAVLMVSANKKSKESVEEFIASKKQTKNHPKYDCRFKQHKVNYIQPEIGNYWAYRNIGSIVIRIFSFFLFATCWLKYVFISLHVIISKSTVHM